MGDWKLEVLVKVAVHIIAETQRRLSAPLVDFRYQSNAYVSFFDGGA